MPHNALQAQDPFHVYRHPATIRGTERPVPLVATSYDIRIAGGLALIRCERTFRNVEDCSIEATMTFPVPAAATLVNLEATTGGRVLKARAAARKVARANYEDGVDRGKTSVLHEEVFRGVHMLSVSHIPPGGEVITSGIWAMTVSAGPDGSGFLRIPVTVGDIYERSPLAESDDLAHSAAVLHEADVTLSSLQGVAFLHGSQMAAEGRARVKLDGPLDVLVRGWMPLPLAGVAADGRPVSLTVEPCGVEEGALDAALLVNGSLSMGELAHTPGGETKHAVLLSGLRSYSASLSHRDRLDVWQFGDAPHYVGSDLGAAVNLLNARLGGTETGRAITQVLAGPTTRDVIIASDGKSFALGDVHAAVRSGRRFHVILIGKDSLDAGLGQLAAMTGGQIFVASGCGAADSVAKAFQAARMPHTPKAFFRGEPHIVETMIGGMLVRAAWGDASRIVGISVPGMLPRPKSGSVPAIISTDAAAIPEAVAEAADSNAVFGRAVAALAASLAIGMMDDEEEATALAVSEGIVTHLTSMVLVDEESSSLQGLPAQRKVPNMSPLTASAHQPLYASRTMAAYSASAAGPSVPMMNASLADLDFERGGAGPDNGSAHIPMFNAPRKNSVLRGVPSGRRVIPLTVGDGSVIPLTVGDGIDQAGWLPSGHPLTGPGSPSWDRHPSREDRSRIPGDIMKHPRLWPHNPPADGAANCAHAAHGLAHLRIDWASDPSPLAEGRLSRLPPATGAAILAAAALADVVRLAASLGRDPAAVVLALLAGREPSDRAASRFGRRVLEGADARLVASAQAALGF